MTLDADPALTLIAAATPMVSDCRINSPMTAALPKSLCALGEIRPQENLTIVNLHIAGFLEGTCDRSVKPLKAIEAA